MNREELKKAMASYNRNYGNDRFYLEDGKLFVGTYNNDFDFNKDFDEALEFINKYGMFKKDEECYGRELYYKGFIWECLTNKQRQSVIDLYKSYDNFNTDETQYGRLFNSNKCSLVF